MKTTLTPRVSNEGGAWFLVIVREISDGVDVRATTSDRRELDVSTRDEAIACGEQVAADLQALEDASAMAPCWVCQRDTQHLVAVLTEASNRQTCRVCGEASEVAA